MEDKREKKSHKSSGKHKKSKKHKRQKEKRSSSSDSDSDKVEMEWVEAPPPRVEKRESWMQNETFVPTLSREQMASGSLSTRERKKQAEAQRKEEEEAVMKTRELNPHWAKGGTGVPEEGPGAPRLPSHSVGDGGYNHLYKARIRLREQAEREGRSMEEVAVERWGSLATLDGLIEEAEARMLEHSRSRHRNDRSHHSSHDRRSPEQSVRFQRPSDYDRHRRRDKCNVSSTRRSDKDNKVRSSPTEQSYDRDISPNRSLSKGDVARQPAWKKVKPISPDVKETLREPSPSSSPEITPNRPPSPSDDAAENSRNRLAAKRMRAELLGSSTSSLKREEKRVELTHSSRDANRVMLTKVDSSGQQRPILSSREDAGFERKTDRKQKRSNKYFDDSSKYSLKQMFEREKMTTTEDNLEMFLDVSAQCKDNMEDDETSDISKKATQKMGHTAQEEKDIRKAMQQHQKLSSALERCEYCFDKPNMKQHLIVAIYDQVLISIPNFQSLTKGHCLIVPKRHVSSFLALDEDEWNGFQDALASVRRLFRESGKSVICMETSLQFGRCPHAIVECIPVPSEQGDLAPLYFKKAILESEEEWAHNIKLVDLTKKGLRRSIPKNLPYFCVQFDPAIHGGYAHIIEDEKAFPRNFGKEVVGGMLDIDYNHLYKNRSEDPLKKSKEAMEFTKTWEEFHAE